MAKSAPFKSLAPFPSRLRPASSKYRVFPVDYINPPSGASTAFGCIFVSPSSPVSVDGPSGSGGTDPAVVIYQITNSGGKTLTWNASTADAYLILGASSGTLDPGESYDLHVTFDDDAIRELPDQVTTATVSISDPDNACGDTTVSLVITKSSSTEFSQYDGPFAYPAFAYEYDDEFYLTESVSGTNRFKFSPIGTNPSDRACSPSGDNAASGVCTTTFSGSSTYSLAGVLSGALSATVNRAGGFGAYDFPGVPGTTETVTATTWSGLLTAAGLMGAAIGWSSEISYKDASSATTEYSTTDTDGHFAGSFGGQYNNIWCGGDSILRTYSSKITPSDLGIPVARTGTAARTQRLESYDEPTRTYAGNISTFLYEEEVDITKPQITLELKYLVTPDVGDPYELLALREYTITGPNLSEEITYPPIVGADVYLVSAVSSYRRSAFDDFSSYAEAEIVESLPFSPGWSAVGTFLAPPPNNECYDDMSGYEDGYIELYPLGIQWSDSGSSSMRDSLEAYDDFSGYELGTINGYGAGFGWSMAGGSQTADYVFAYDDFSSYSDGTTYTFDSYVFQSMWSDSGTSAVEDYSQSYDDFASYSDGTLNIFNFTGSVFTDVLNLWDGDGTSAVLP